MADAVVSNAARWAKEWTLPNVTSIVPAGKDIFLAGLYRILAVPGLVDNASAIDLSQGFTAPATARQIFNTSAAGAGAAAAAATMSAADISAAAEALTFRAKVAVETARSFSTVVAYITSKWFLGTIGMGILVSRIRIYCSTRRSVALSWDMRLALRIIPIVWLVYLMRSLLRAAQCQTSPIYASILDESVDLPFLHHAAQALLLGPSDYESCRSMGMIGVGEDGAVHPDMGSLSLLAPIFWAFGFSSLIQSLIAAIEGKVFVQDTGLSLFEHSLAFSEAEAAHGTDLGRIFEKVQLLAQAGEVMDGRPMPDMKNLVFSRSPSILTRAAVTARLNTTPEMFLFVFLSACNHLTNHILGVFNLQGRFRLVNTGTWAFAYMAVILWSIVEFVRDEPQNTSILRFPTVYLVGLFPHLAVMCGLVICALIYAVALLIVALSMPGAADDQQPRTFRQRLLEAHENMQVTMSLGGIRFSMHHDFFTALLKVGFTLITIGTEAVYLIEGRSVEVRQGTWLEAARFDEVSTLLARDNDRYPTGPAAQSSGTRTARASVYAVELKGEALAKLTEKEKLLRDNPSRWLMAINFLVRITRLLIRCVVSLCTYCCRCVGLTPLLNTEIRFPLLNRPREIVAGLQSRQGQSKVAGKPAHSLDDEKTDIESRIRRSMVRGKGKFSEREQEELDDAIYDFWKTGRLFGRDNSSDYVDSADEDEDATSMISVATTDVSDTWQDIDQGSIFEESKGRSSRTRSVHRTHDSEEEDATTPRQLSPPRMRDMTPAYEPLLDPIDLAQLLAPRTLEHRAEAEALAAHLSSEGILTRSQFRRWQELDRARVLLPPTISGTTLKPRLSREEEAQLLELIIVSKRQQRQADAAAATSSQQAGGSTWANGAAGLGDSGPQCVVCQSTPRTIIVWPCRCLSLCDDCRVTLAMKNFDKCVCCRSDVEGFSRIFVP